MTTLPRGARSDELQTGQEAYCFDGFRLDPLSGMAVRQDGSELRLRPKTFAMLRFFLDNPGRLMSRDELIGRLWPGVAVTDDSLTQCVGDLRQAFGDRAAHVLRTIPKRGYMLTAQVRREASPSLELPFPGAGAQAGSDQPRAVPTRDASTLRRETTTVHRFETPDGDRACLQLADGLVTDLVAALTCLEGLRLAPIGNGVAHLGYRVTGEVRAVGQQLRVTVRLEDAATGTALWADRLDQDRGHPPELPVAALTALVVHIGQQVDRHCLAVARQKPISALTARELHLIGREHHQRHTEADTRLAEEMFDFAMVADPDYAHAYAWQAYTVHRTGIHDWGSPAEQAARDAALHLARRGVQIDPTSPLCLSRLAFALMLNQQWDEAAATARAALTSDRPAFTAARNPCCEVLAHAGFPGEAVAIARGTIALDPLCSPTTHALLGRALLLAGQAEDALPFLRICTARLPDYVAVHDSMIVAAAECGRTSEAEAAQRELVRLTPGWVPRNNTGLWYFQRGADLERFQAAHRLIASRQPDASAAAAFRVRQERKPPLAPSGQATREVVVLRQETLRIHLLRSMAGDTAPAFMSRLTAELVRHEDLRVVVARPDDRAKDGFAIKGDIASENGVLSASILLEDTATGATVWSRQVEGSFHQAVGVPVKAIVALAAETDIQVARRTLERARGKRDDELSAREVTWLGTLHYQHSTEAGTASAQHMFQRATQIDPGYAAAHAWHAYSAARVVLHGWHGSDHGEAADQAIRSARRAVELVPNSPLCNSSLATALALKGRWEEAVNMARLALRSDWVASNPARSAAGDVLTSAGHSAEAEEVLRYVIARDPHCSPVFHMMLGRALLMGGRAEEAVGEFRRCVALLPDYALCHRTMAVAAIEADLAESARDALHELVRLRPDWVQRPRSIYWFLRNGNDVRRYQTAFDLAVRLYGVVEADEATRPPVREVLETVAGLAGGGCLGPAAP